MERLTHCNAIQNNTEAGVVTVKEDAGFGQVGEKDEKVTISEHDMRFCMKELQRVRSRLGLYTLYSLGFATDVAFTGSS